MAKQQLKIAPPQAKQQNSQFTAQIVVNDLASSANFYQKAFGFKDVSQQQASMMPTKNSQEARVLECNGLPILLVSEKASRALKGYEAKSPASLHAFSPTVITVLCSNIQKMYEQAINAGAKPIQAPHKTQGGATTFLVAGPENYAWRFIDNFSQLSQAWQ